MLDLPPSPGLEKLNETNPSTNFPHTNRASIHETEYLMNRRPIHPIHALNS